MGGAQSGLGARLEAARDRLRARDGVGADRVLAGAPDDVAVLQLRAVAAHLQQDDATAEALIAAALAAARAPTAEEVLGSASAGPVAAGAARVVAALWNDLGNLRLESGRTAEAIEAYRTSLDAHEEDPPTWANLATALRVGGDAVGAGTAALRSIELDPDATRGRSALSAALHALTAERRHEDALDLVRRWCALEPDHPAARHRLAALGGLGGLPVPRRAPDDYVTALFDAVADQFDPHLAGLGYRAPELAAERVAELLGAPAGVLVVADLGCGTGLAGRLVRPWARTLVGCDLSLGMLRRAQRRGCYDMLHRAELVTFLRHQPDAYDLVVCVDTLCYLGDLGEVAEAVRGALRPGGVLVATVEELAGEGADGWRLTPSGRYAHRARELELTSGAAGLHDVTLRPVHLRLEAGEPVAGLVWSARRPESTDPCTAGADTGLGAREDGRVGVD
ncbi:methyltransferase [Terrabacter sp. NPDC000476]|uniref:methyltransferase n=1 Tax=Terrabacter sp. NPDC000476 TaxID=3154258 RepID=UPI00332AC176